MKTYILTEHERKLLLDYTKKGKISYGYYQLRHRAKKDLQRLKEDIKLLERILETPE